MKTIERLRNEAALAPPGVKCLVVQYQDLISILAVVEAAKNAARWQGTPNANCSEAHMDYDALEAALAKVEA